MLIFHKDRCESALKDIISLKVFAFFRIINISALHHSKDKGTVTVDKTNSPANYFQRCFAKCTKLASQPYFQGKKRKSFPQDAGILFFSKGVVKYLLLV